MTPKKWVALAIYAVAAIYGLIFASPETADIIMWIFIALPIVHVLEFGLAYRILKSAGGSMGNHFLQTLVFGYVHWLPLRKKT